MNLKHTLNTLLRRPAVRKLKTPANELPRGWQPKQVCLPIEQRGADALQGLWVDVALASRGR